jgi:IS30 family transposase
MPENERKKGKHLSREERQEIQKGLREHRTFQEIAMMIGCTPETISKEIRNHRYHKTVDTGRYVVNRCKYRESCRRRDVCQKRKGKKCRIPCRECISCNKLCPHFVDAPCRIADKAPYVCNNCPKSRSCLFDKYLYNADYAHKEYVQTLHHSRMGIDLTRDELAALDGLISPLILKGQPLIHIMQEHEQEIPCSLRTLYTYIGKGYLGVKPLDLRRGVRYKKRKKKTVTAAPSRKKEGRHYEDFLKWVEAHPDARVVEMDTVEGVKGGKLLQTFLWRENNLMLGILIPSKEMENTAGVMNWLEEELGEKSFRELFEIILTDNGTEFSDPLLFETGKDGTQRCRMYYCEPRMSNQKGQLEKNHEYIRYVLPKGKPFDELTQTQVMQMINQINNTARPKFHGLSPMKLALQSFDRSALEKLGFTEIPPDEICLNAELFK